jgi:hypothetical protein
VFAIVEKPGLFFEASQGLYILLESLPAQEKADQINHQNDEGSTIANKHVFN